MYFNDEYDVRNNIYHTKLYDGCHIVCDCKICANEDNSVWSISAWYTSHSYQHKGYGVQTLAHILSEMREELGMPDKIEYIWNGANQYVMDWLSNHFDPVCKLPLAVQKCDDVDDWTAHMYTINKDKLFEYLHIA